VGESTPPSPKRVEVPRPQEQEGAPEPPRFGVEGDPITISDGSSGDGPSKDARPMDEEVEASPVVKRMPWPIGLHSVEEQRKRGEEDAATAAGGAAAAAVGRRRRRGGAAARRSPARGAAGAGSTVGATGALGAAAEEPAVGGAAQATTTQSALASAANATRA